MFKRTMLLASSMALVAAGCGGGNREADVSAKDGDEPETSEPMAPPHGIEISMDDVQTVARAEELVPDSVTLLPPLSDDSITADLARIRAQADVIPEDLAGHQPEILFGRYQRQEATDADGTPVVVLRFNDVMAVPFGHPTDAGEELPPPSPSRVVALYDAASGEQVGLWVFGCGNNGERCPD
jgi:hypothetical protein